MTNDMQVFHHAEFGEFQVIDIEGRPYFPATKCAKVLGYTNPQKAIRDHCNGVNDSFTPTTGGSQLVKYIPEGDLYRLIIRSKLPAAGRFERWVFDEVLPSIRRHGLYADTALLAAPELLVKAGQALIAAREERQTLERQIELDAPKVAFADAVSESGEVISFVQMAKILRENGLDIGRTRLCAEWRGLGLLISQRCVDYNTPTQKAANLKLFRLCAKQHVFPDGRSVVQYSTRVTGKGQQWILNYFRRKRGV